ncbi:acyltransferase [Caldalkalibacillus salinus]|uniref:acyltransferase n=1 Tax=Caldalkalibacillus salinus TaxID=2803787 RepID=UPI001920C190|nr:acyltransferase [Caldalkalibacillus salinus]
MKSNKKAKKVQGQSLPDLSQRQYIEEVDMMRGLAILGVLFVHATSVPTVTMEHSSLYPIYIFLNRFGKLGTPTFIFLSSLVLFYTYYVKALNTQRIRQFYQKRLLYILVPYLVWSVGYHVLLLTHGFESWQQLQQFDLKAFITDDLAFGNAYTHLYFVIISIQFYVLFPVLLFALQRMKWLAKVIFFLGIIGQWGFFFYNHYVLEFPYKGSLFFSYLTYYTLGAVVGVYFERITAWLQNVSIKGRQYTGTFKGLVFLTWLGTGLYHVYLYYNAYVYNDWVNTRWYELAWNLYTLVSILFLYYVAVWLKEKVPAIVKKTVVKLGVASFGIYLVHPMLLYFWRNLGEPSEIMRYHLYIAGGWAVALFGSWLIVLIVQYLPGSWMIFGQGKKKKRGKQKVL